MTSIGEQIKEARGAKGMAQDALAETVHVTAPRPCLRLLLPLFLLGRETRPANI